VLEASEVAKAWLVELVAVAPLERAATLPGPPFAADAPQLCAAVVAALGSEAAFDDLEPGGPLSPVAAGAGGLAGARDALEAVTALEALRAVTWAALVGALDRPVPALVADLADRLGAVMATLAAAALEPGRPTDAVRPGDRGPLAAVLRSAAEPARPEEEPRGEADPPPAPREPREPPDRDAWQPPASAPEGAGSPPRAPAPAAAPTPAADPAPTPTNLRALRFAADEVRLAAVPPFDASGPEVEDAGAFSARRVAPWTAAIERRLARQREDGLPFGVLCVELVDLDRMLAAARGGEVTAALEAAEAALCAQLRPADALVRERPGRYWLTTPDTRAEEARSLAHRIVAAVAAAPPLHGAPLRAAAGVASAPADATDAGELEARAEEGVFAARAAGLGVTDT
jgi:GGDEF domain-containing protein